MEILIIIFILLFLIGAIGFLKPSKKMKALSAIRLVAYKEGFKIGSTGELRKKFKTWNPQVAIYQIKNKSKYSKINYIKSLAGTLAYLASRQGDAVGLYCAGKNFHTEIKPKRNATHLRIVLDELAEIKAEGETGLAESLHEAAEGIDQRALVVVISDLYIEPDILNSCFQHLRFRKHDVVTFHLLDQSEVDFDFDRPTRFVDMEGGVPIMADPSLVSKQYQQAITGYLADLETVMLDAAIDYHRVNLRDPVDEILARFLVGRKPKKK